MQVNVRFFVSQLSHLLKRCIYIYISTVYVLDVYFKYSLPTDFKKCLATALFYYTIYTYIHIYTLEIEYLILSRRVT